MKLSDAQRISKVSSGVHSRRDLPTQIQDLSVRVTTIHHSREVEHFGTVIHFSPESILEPFLLRLESCWRFNEIQMGEYSDELGQTMRGQCRQSLEGFLKVTKLSEER